MIKATQSRVNLWRKCHHAHFLKHVEKLKRKRKKRPLVFGTIVHRMIDADANADDPFEVLDDIAKKEQKVFRAEREMYGDIIEDIRTIMKEYYEYYKNSSLIYLRREKKSAEHVFEIEIDNGILMAGKIDGIGRTGEGGGKRRTWLVEHKSSERAPPNEDHRWRNLQSSVYIRAIDMLGWYKLDGTLWDYIRSKPPTKPGLLKDGSLSTRDIDSLPSKVIAALKEYKFNPKDYRALIDKATMNRKNYFIRIPSVVKKPVVDTLFNDFVNTAREIADKGEKANDRSIGRHCDWCDYEPLCRAAIQGLDVDFVKEREYETHDPEAYHKDEEARSVTSD